jgi:NADPH:quinone reductase-like Zn-dependent oxidoreductase
VKSIVGAKYADYVVNTSDKDFIKKMSKISLKLKPNTCLDAVAGPFTGLMFKFLGFQSTVILYGLLSDKPASDINAIDFMGKAQTLESFLLTTALGKLQKKELNKVFKTANNLYTTTLKTSVNARFGLHQVEEAIEYYI